MMVKDVAIIGGGPSGAIAAIACARIGVKTVLVERNGFCGGSLTAAGVGPMMTFHAGKRQVIQGIAQELVDRLTDIGGCGGHVRDATGYCATVTPFDAEALKLILDQMLEESGCEVLYHTSLLSCQKKEEKICSVELMSGIERISLSSKVWIDATGNGELFALAGIPYEIGRKEDGLCQPMTMNVKIGHVDLEQVRKDIATDPDDFRLLSLEQLPLIKYLSLAGYTKLMTQAVSEKWVSFEREVVLFFETPHPGEIILNITRMTGYNPTDPRDLSKAELIGRKQAWEAFHLLKDHIPAFANAQLLQTGMNVGIRESRRLKGKYQLTADDILTGKQFSDSIAVGGYPIDIHNPKGNDTFTQKLPEGATYQIPYGCLITKEAKNLIVTGRCISATHEACAAIRVSPIVMAIGQAGGTAAALSIQRGVMPFSLDVKELQEKLTEDKAIIE